MTPLQYLVENFINEVTGKLRGRKNKKETPGPKLGSDRRPTEKTQSELQSEKEKGEVADVKWNTSRTLKARQEVSNTLKKEVGPRDKKLSKVDTKMLDGFTSYREVVKGSIKDTERQLAAAVNELESLRKKAKKVTTSQPSAVMSDINFAKQKIKHLETTLKKQEDSLKDLENRIKALKPEKKDTSSASEKLRALLDKRR